MEIVNYKEKYLKYKNKYLQLKGGFKTYYLPCEICHYTKSIYTRNTTDDIFNRNVYDVLKANLVPYGINLYKDSLSVIFSQDNKIVLKSIINNKSYIYGKEIEDNNIKLLKYINFSDYQDMGGNYISSPYKKQIGYIIKDGKWNFPSKIFCVNNPLSKISNENLDFFDSYVNQNLVGLKCSFEGHIDEMMCFMPYGIDNYKIWFYDEIRRDDINLGNTITTEIITEIINNFYMEINNNFFNIIKNIYTQTDQEYIDREINKLCSIVFKFHDVDINQKIQEYIATGEYNIPEYKLGASYSVFAQILKKTYIDNILNFKYNNYVIKLVNENKYIDNIFKKTIIDIFINNRNIPLSEQFDMVKTLLTKCKDEILSLLTLDIRFINPDDIIRRIKNLTEYPEIKNILLLYFASKNDIVFSKLINDINIERRNNIEIICESLGITEEKFVYFPIKLKFASKNNRYLKEDKIFELPNPTVFNRIICETKENISIFISTGNNEAYNIRIREIIEREQININSYFDQPKSINIFYINTQSYHDEIPIGGGNGGNLHCLTKQIYH
jgi:hypothetical protein